MNIRIRSTGQSLQEYGFRTLHPDVSFPTELTPEVLDEFGADFLHQGIVPEHSRFQTVSEDGVEQLNGQWFTKYVVNQKDQEAIVAATETQWNSMRSLRNQLLAECDWTQLTDSPLDALQKTEWATYRQGLRDITSSADPFNITWPTKP